MQLDVKTLFLLNVVVAAVSAGVCLLSWLHHRDMPGLRGWAIGLALGAAGSCVVVLRTPGVLAVDLIVAGNLMIIAGYVTVWGSMRHFNRKSDERRLVVVVTLLVGVPFALLVVGGAGIRVRVIAISLVIAALCFLSAWESLRPWRLDPLTARIPTAIAFAAIAAAMAVRAGLATLAAPPEVDTPLFDPTAGASLFVNTVGIIGVTLGLLMMANERLGRRYAVLASIDELTGLPNRRFFLEQGQRLVSRAHRDARPCCVLMIDLDRFSEVNARFGHPGGDLALAAFARFAGECLRPNDLVARYGGEEFCVVLANMGLSDGLVVAERLRQGTEGLKILSGGRPLPITVSIGVAEIRQSDLRTGIRRADVALYKAKAAGRNQVRAASESEMLATVS